ncbi:MAG: hypothetical protein GC185_07250 [Alphaproteobacteria bacterium]|nr:hypothetical protein [Alphaproteobacteria bacterium]
MSVTVVVNGVFSLSGQGLAVAVTVREGLAQKDMYALYEDSVLQITEVKDKKKDSVLPEADETASAGEDAGLVLRGDPLPPTLPAGTVLQFDAAEAFTAKTGRAVTDANAPAPGFFARLFRCRRGPRDQKAKSA